MGHRSHRARFPRSDAFGDEGDDGLKLPACLDCEFGDRAFPCRRNGAFAPGILAAAYRENVLRDDGETGEGGTHWSFACVDTLTADHPDLAWQVLTAHLLAMIETPGEAALLAAGPLEDLLAHHRPAMIDRVAALAARSARFRFVLSGVWPQGARGALWSRIEAARAPGPSLDAGDPLPPA